MTDSFEALRLREEDHIMTSLGHILAYSKNADVEKLKAELGLIRTALDNVYIKMQTNSSAFIDQGPIEVWGSGYIEHMQNPRQQG